MLLRQRRLCDLKARLLAYRSIVSIQLVDILEHHACVFITGKLCLHCAVMIVRVVRTLAERTHFARPRHGRQQRALFRCHLRSGVRLERTTRATAYSVSAHARVDPATRAARHMSPKFSKQHECRVATKIGRAKT